MENIKNTTKYFQSIRIVLISAVLLMFSPIFVSAQITEDPISRGTIAIQESDVSGFGNQDFNTMDTWDINGDYFPGNNYYNERVMNFDVPSNEIQFQQMSVWDINGNYYPDNNYYSTMDNANVSGNNYSAPVTLTSGGFTINENPVTNNPTQNNYNYPTNGTVMSGGFTDNGYGYYNDYYGSYGSQVTPYYYNQSSGVVTSGGFYDPGNTVMPSTHYTQPIGTLYSGNFYDGGNSSYNTPQQTYYYPQATYYSQPTQTMPNQVLAFTDTNPSLSSVYLSDIPNTGFSDYYGILLFISILVSWSAVLAYVFLKRKIKSQTVLVEVVINSDREKNNLHPFDSGLVKQNYSDKSDINEVEQYARMNKVLLSSDASIKLVKLARLGKINASEYIKSIAKGEWTAIGESQILV